jgi:hypothetical protein
MNFRAPSSLALNSMGLELQMMNGFTLVPRSKLPQWHLEGGRDLQQA